MAVVQTVLALPIDENRTLNVILEDRAPRVKFSLKKRDGTSYQEREEWYLSRDASMKLAMFLANIREAAKPARDFADEETPVDRPRRASDDRDS